MNSCTLVHRSRDSEQRAQTRAALPNTLFDLLQLTGNTLDCLVRDSGCLWGFKPQGRECALLEDSSARERSINMGLEKEDEMERHRGVGGAGGLWNNDQKRTLG